MIQQHNNTDEKGSGHGAALTSDSICSEIGHLKHLGFNQAAATNGTAKPWMDDGSPEL